MQKLLKINNKEVIELNSKINRTKVVENSLWNLLNKADNLFQISLITISLMFTLKFIMFCNECNF